MNAVLPPKQTEFVHHRPENLILLENYADGTVVIRAARNNFSERRKTAFIREMAAEGFIADHLEWVPHSERSSQPEVRWIIDHSWLQIHPIIRQRATRVVVTWLAVASVMWLILMITAIARAP